MTYFDFTVYFSINMLYYNKELKNYIFLSIAIKCMLV